MAGEGGRHLRSGHSTTVTEASAKFSLRPASSTAATYLRGGWERGACSTGRAEESRAGNCRCRGEANHGLLD